MDTKFLSVFIISVTLANVYCQQNDAILRNDFEGPFPDGSYRWAIQTQGGIFHEQKGSPRQASNGETSELVEGQYQYSAPDGQIIRLLYTADENGFHPTGDHLPTPPPIPEAIQRALAYIQAKTGQNQRFG